MKHRFDFARAAAFAARARSAAGSWTRALWEKGRVDDFIPVELVEPVAEVLKWVKSLEDARREEKELDAIEITSPPYRSVAR